MLILFFIGFLIGGCFDTKDSTDRNRGASSGADENYMERSKRSSHLSVSKDEILADGSDYVEMTLRRGDGSIIDEGVTYFSNGMPMKNNRFSTLRPGSYELRAIFEERKSNKIKVMALEKRLFIWGSKDSMEGNGIDYCQLYAIDENHNQLLDGISFYMGDGLMNSSKFSTQEEGQYEFRATFGNVKSNVFKLSVKKSKAPLRFKKIPIIVGESFFPQIESLEDGDIKYLLDGNILKNPVIFRDSGEHRLEVTDRADTEREGDSWTFTPINIVANYPRDIINGEESHISLSSDRPEILSVVPRDGEMLAAIPSIEGGSAKFNIYVEGTLWREIQIGVREMKQIELEYGDKDGVIKSTFKMESGEKLSFNISIQDFRGGLAKHLSNHSKRKLENLPIYVDEKEINELIVAEDSLFDIIENSMDPKLLMIIGLLKPEGYVNMTYGINGKEMNLAEFCLLNGQERYLPILINNLSMGRVEYEKGGYDMTLHLLFKAEKGDLAYRYLENGATLGTLMDGYSPLMCALEMDSNYPTIARIVDWRKEDDTFGDLLSRKYYGGNTFLHGLVIAECKLENECYVREIISLLSNSKIMDRIFDIQNSYGVNPFTTAIHFKKWDRALLMAEKNILRVKNGTFYTYLDFEGNSFLNFLLRDASEDNIKRILGFIDIEKIKGLSQHVNKHGEKPLNILDSRVDIGKKSKIDIRKIMGL